MHKKIILYMDSNFSEASLKIISYSREEAARLHCNYIGIEHLFLGLLREPTGIVGIMLTPISQNIKEIKEQIEQKITEKDVSVSINSNLNTPLTLEAERVISLAFLEQIKHKKTSINPEHLLLAILFIDDSKVYNILKKYNYDYQSVEKILKIATEDKLQEGISIPYKGNNVKDDFNDDDIYEDNDEDEDGDEEIGDDDDDDIDLSESGTSLLQTFGTNLTATAAAGQLDPIVGRDKELERMTQILCRRKKNNPIIIGESGVGKSALIEGLAIRITEKKVPCNLLGKQIYSIDVASIVAGTKYRGDFEKRIKAIIDELKRNKDIILFIDEIHTLIGAGNAAGSIDASSIFKPPLSKGEIQCIGTTTFDEYRQYIEKDVAFARRFQKVVVEPATCDETIQILSKIKNKYEEHHLVEYSDDAIKACVLLTNRYITDRFLPDKAIDAMDEAGSRVHIKNSYTVPDNINTAETKLNEILSKKEIAIRSEHFEEASKLHNMESKISSEISQLWTNFKEESKSHPAIVTEENVAEVVSLMSGIPVNKISSSETEKLINLEKDLMTKVIGQDDAVRKVAKAIRRNRAGLKDPNKPIGSFIFMGQTGVGKTYLARTLAEMMFDSEDALIRIDMGEYIEKFSVSRLIGAPPGYVGYEEGGQLTEKVRRRPYSVILLDEIEKAHPDVYNLLLQMLDYGVMTDGLGRKIDFKNTIIIMTSNIGSRQVKDFGSGVGFVTSNADSQNEYAKNIIDKALKKTFSPEFLNRIDEIINFNVLTKDNMKTIINLEIATISKRMRDLNMELKVNDGIINYILNKECDIQYGARPIHRAIQKYIEDPVSEKIILENAQNKKVNIIVDYIDSNVNVSIESVTDNIVPAKKVASKKKKKNEK